MACGTLSVSFSEQINDKSSTVRLADLGQLLSASRAQYDEMQIEVGVSNVSIQQKPIIVGGVGGSGTRVVSELLQQLGFYMGADRNTSQDNLWFTLLFRRTDWYKQTVEHHPERIQTALDALTALMTGTDRLDAKTRMVYVRACADHIFGRNQRTTNYLTLVAWTIRRFFQLIRWRPFEPRQYRGWGWKEPNSHIYLPFLADYFPKMRYIHVIRHGLDMAYSSNRQQLQLWHPQYDVSVPDDPSQIPSAALTYWIRANERALEHGETLLGNRFLVLNYDALCTNPVKSMDNLLTFLGVNVAEDEAEKLQRLVNKPSSIGRYRTRDLSIFTEAQLVAVERFGFSVII